MIRILTSLVAILTVGTVQAQSPVPTNDVPKLIVGITIDQLRGDYLEQFKHTFGDKGFKRLLSEGLVYQNMQFDFANLNSASSIATIYTGANPNYHGIVDTHRYSAKTRRVENIFADDNFIGNYTQDKFSPIAIKGSTIADELKIASRGQSDVFSFAAQANQALVSAGHAGNTAYWIDDYSGKWASSTYYKDFYWTVDQDNRKADSYSVKAWALQWSPLSDKKVAGAFPYTQTENGFRHNLGTDKETYILSKYTPFANENVRSSAINLIAKADLGKRVAPDFLALTFYAGKYPKADDYGLELKDTYVRLDQDIEVLLDELDKTVGLRNTLIFVTSTGYFESATSTEEGVAAGGGTFYINRCEALLNMYLMAIYGQNEKWVDKYYNGQIFLNRELIKAKQIKLKEIQEVAAEFISEFSGVQNVYTQHQIYLQNTSNEVEYIKNGFSNQNVGDLILEIQPSYKVIDENTESNHTTSAKLVRNDAISSPVIFFGANIKAEKIKRTIKATEIAPSIAYIMRIRAPSAAKEFPLPELQ